MDQHTGHSEIPKVNAERCLRENFMMPLNLREELLKNTQAEDVYETLAQRLLLMVDETKFSASELSDTQLEIGFRTLKTKLAERNADYR